MFTASVQDSLFSLDREVRDIQNEFSIFTRVGGWHGPPWFLGFALPRLLLSWWQTIQSS
jgi:hypothetical protein